MDSVQKPDWLTDDFISACIKNKLNIPQGSELEIKDVALNYLVPKGENFLSLMYRAVTSYQRVDEATDFSDIKEESIVLKVSHQATFFKYSELVFPKEMVMYAKVLPNMHSILQTHGIDTLLTCRLLHSVAYQSPCIIVLEDLKAQGYTVSDRRKGLNFEHSKMALSKLAMFHASSKLVFEEMDVDTKNFFKGQVFGDVSRQKGKLTSDKLTHVRTIIDDLSKYDGYDTATKFLEECIVNDHEMYSNAVPFVPDSKFNTIVHGDCWINNIMFKCDPHGDVVDVLFVDLQLSVYKSLATDFLYFMFSSTSLHVRREHYEDLKKFYFDCLLDNWKLLGFADIPTSEEFDKELKRCVMVVNYAVCFVLPLYLIEIDEVMQQYGIEFFTADDIIKVGIYHSTTQVNEMRRVSIKIAQDQGLLDTFPDFAKRPLPE